MIVFLSVISREFFLPQKCSLKIERLGMNEGNFAVDLPHHTFILKKKRWFRE
jgi:hypothetical protein